MNSDPRGFVPAVTVMPEATIECTGCGRRAYGPRTTSNQSDRHYLRRSGGRIGSSWASNRGENVASFLGILVEGAMSASFFQARKFTTWLENSCVFS
jgi:hypothetical protein